MRLRRWIVLLGLCLGRLHADAIPGGTGIMYDEDSSFVLTAPKGWVLDNGVAKGLGVCAVFYPVGSSWGKGEVVFYVNTRGTTPRLKTPSDAVDVDMNDMHQHGSPESKATRLADITLAKGGVASVWEYTGDHWGNAERTAFVPLPKSIAAIVLTARSGKAMEDALPAFHQLVASYRYLGPMKIKP